MTEKKEEKKLESETTKKGHKIDADCIFCTLYGDECKGALICPRYSACSERWTSKVFPKIRKQKKYQW